MKTSVIKILITFYLTFMNFADLYSQQGWYQLNTGLPLNYYSVHFIDKDNGLACSNGSVAKTTNGGNNWERFNTGFSNKITDIKMLSLSKAVGVCDGGLIIKSTNGGANWFSVFTTPPGFIYMINLVFPDTLNGYAVAQTNTQSGNFYKTSNGGDNWTLSYVNNPKYISFISPSTGYIHGSYTLGPPFNTYHMVIYKTINNGQNWNSVFDFQTVSINPGPVFFVNEMTAYKVMQFEAYILENPIMADLLGQIFTALQMKLTPFILSVKTEAGLPVITENYYLLLMEGTVFQNRIVVSQQNFFPYFLLMTLLGG